MAKKKVKKKSAPKPKKPPVVRPIDFDEEEFEFAEFYDDINLGEDFDDDDF